MTALLLIVAGIVIVFFATSLRSVPSNPTHVAVVTLFGKRQRQVKYEGLRLFPFYPLTGAILINVTKKNQDLTKMLVRTRDLAELEISASITWTPLPDFAIEYLNHGNEEGVRKTLANIVEEGLRKWAIASEGGPQHWQEAILTERDTSAILLKIIAGLSPDIGKEESDDIGLKMRSREGIAMPQLGIVLNSINIREIYPKGLVVNTSEKVRKEYIEREGEKVEIVHVADLVMELKRTLNISDAQALDIVQTERGKVERKIKDLRLGISPEIEADVLKILDLHRADARL